MKHIPIKEMNHLELLEYIRSVYGEDVATEYDKNCIDTIEAKIANGKMASITAIYSKIKVTPKESTAIYWPIGKIYEELNLVHGLNLLKEFS